MERPRRDPLHGGAPARSTCPSTRPWQSSLLVFSDVLYAIQADGPNATLLSLAGVVLLVLVAFGLGGRSVRSLADAGWVLASLAVGVLWFAGIAGALIAPQHAELHRPAHHVRDRRRLRTNIVQQRRVDHARSIADIVRTTGGAVALCSITTMLGYASLLVARNQALFSFGLLSVIGELTCLGAALVALPAVLPLARAPPRAVRVGGASGGERATSTSASRADGRGGSARLGQTARRRAAAPARLLARERLLEERLRHGSRLRRALAGHRDDRHAREPRRAPHARLEVVPVMRGV